MSMVARKASAFAAIALLLPVATAPVFADQRTRFKALCSAYSPFEPCEVFLYSTGRITANIPRGYLDASRRSIKSIDICDADVACKPLMSENLEYVWKDSRVSPFTAVVDFRLKYLNDFSKVKTLLLRFYNRRAAEDFGSKLLEISSGKPQV
jgi:hypothetical protein